ncbi:BURP domain-containing protein 5-like isoform X5 [Nymphaea colorata]|uniref:BURP domain-containing protein 5-like isoform X5 n=1 Tax=Nymphaea colorata TaxID=210225 RepID=UPI00214E748D|nr:BURP domain-containing protein 5-like isoform X5 [Nymphaea colorata]
MANFFPFFLLFLSALMLVGASSSKSMEMSSVGYWNKLLPRTPIPTSLHAFLPKDIDDPTQRKYAGSMKFCLVYHKYKLGTTLDQLKGDREINFLFLEGNLKPGSKTKKLDFVKKLQETSGWPTLLPRREAQGFPFSSSKLADILKRFSLNPNSADASIVKHTLEDCEMEPNKGETRYCATSLESMVDFAVSQLKTNDLQLLTYSFVNKEEREPQSRAYTVQPGVVELPSSQAVVCHIQSYPYAVFHCHKPVNTKSYIVPLVAEEDGSRVSAGAVCHTDTSSWNPNHASMLALGIKPGTPVCHFLSHGHFVFAPNSAS